MNQSPWNKFGPIDKSQYLEEKNQDGLKPKPSCPSASFNLGKEALPMPCNFKISFSE